MSDKAINIKKQQVTEIVENLKKATSFIIFEYRGMNAITSTNVRNNLYQSNAKLFVLKNNILSRALKELNHEEQAQQIVGPLAIAISFGDELASIKEIHNLTKDFDFINIKMAYLDGKFLDINEINAIANIPSRDGLYSMFLSCLTGPIRNFLYGLKAISEKK